MRTRLFLLLLLAGAISFTAIAQPRRGMQPPLGGKRIMEFLRELNLTDDQKKEFHKLRDESSKQMIALRSKKATLAIELRELFRADPPDKGAIDKKLGEISQIEAQMRQQRVNHWFAVNKTLTPDQQKVWKKALAAGAMMLNRRMKGEMRHRMHQPMPW